MPTYEYRCRDCGDELEVQQSIHDDALTECPSCGGELRKKFSAVGISFKGSGFYKTDSRSGSSATIPSTSGSGSESSGSGTATSDKGADSSPSTGSDSSGGSTSSTTSGSTTTGSGDAASGGKERAKA